MRERGEREEVGHQKASPLCTAPLPLEGNNSKLLRFSSASLSFAPLPLEENKKTQLTLYILIWLSGISPTTSTSPRAFACLSALAWP